MPFLTASRTQAGASGELAHAAAVERLRASYAAIPTGRSVRLAKRTSNLFRPRSRGPVERLDVSALDGVIAIDAVARTANVQGMCTYERLVATTLAQGLMPLVVPQLKTITVGGAVSGLGIESSSFRNGLPHESVLEMDILTGAGDLVTASRTSHPDLFAALPNSYGSVGYAVRLTVELEPVQPYVGLRHVRFGDPESAMAAVETVVTTRAWERQPVDFVDGVVFALDEVYLTLGRFVADPAAAGCEASSDYTGQQIYYRSIRQRARDCLTVHDYLWRWDTDWFWCSEAFGAQNRLLRRVWPAAYRRSDFYHRLVGVENRYGIFARLDRLRGRPASERLVQDVEIPVERTAAFVRWFTGRVGMFPIWLCPLRLRDDGAGAGAGGGAGASDGAGAGAGRAQRDTRPWPLYPLQPGSTYVNAGFWGMVQIATGADDGDVNRLVEDAVSRHHGHKSLYSDAYYDRETFGALYGGEVYGRIKERYDPGHRLTGLYEKAVGRR